MPDHRFFLELGGVVLALAVLARLAGRVGFSPIPLYLIAGLAVGTGGLIPIVTAEGFIETGAEIGIVLLLFMLGLEYTPRELADNLRTAAPAGIVDLVANFTPGLLIGFVIGLSSEAAFLLGGITYMSSTGIIAKTLSDLNWTGNRETPTVLSILVIEDLLMAAYLPLAAILLVGGAATSIAGSLALAVVLVGMVLLVAFRFGPAWSNLLFSRSDETLLLSLLGLVFIAAGIAAALQISTAVGAFLAGIAVSGEAAERARVLLAPLRDLFAAVFFVFFGLQIDPATIPPAAGTALVLAGVTAATKVGSGWWAARAAGVGPRGRFRAGTLLMARGEFSIAIAGIGAAAGLGERFIASQQLTCLSWPSSARSPRASRIRSSPRGYAAAGWANSPRGEHHAGAPAPGSRPARRLVYITGSKR